jgi:hypothetical protein
MRITPPSPVRKKLCIETSRQAAAQVHGDVRRFLDESYARQDFNSPRPVGMRLGIMFISLQ